MESSATPVSNNPPPMPPVSLNDLPSDAVNEVIRQLSSTPHENNWTGNVPSSMVLALFLTGGPFGKAAASIFDTLTTFGDDGPADMPPAKKGAVVHVTTDGDRERLARLIEIFGKHLVSLSVMHDFIRPHAPASHYAWAVAAAAHCTSLRELSLNVGKFGPFLHFIPMSYPVKDFGHPAILQLLAACGGDLQALRLSGERLPYQIAEGIAEHCTRLRRLRVEVDDCNENGLLPVLNGVGGGLSELALVSPGSLASITVLTVANEVCRDLERLELRFLPEGVGRAMDIIGSIVVRNESSLRTLTLSTGLAEFLPRAAADTSRPSASFEIVEIEDRQMLFWPEEG